MVMVVMKGAVAAVGTVAVARRVYLTYRMCSCHSSNLCGAITFVWPKVHEWQCLLDLAE